MNQQKANQITEGVIWKQLLLFFFPILFGTFFQQLYNTVDAIIVGRFVGKEALAAVGGSTSTLINLLVGFFIGLSSGATVIISQFYGARQNENVHRSVHTAIAFSLTGGFVIMLAGFIVSPMALELMGTPDEIMHYSLTYLRIYFAGIIGNLIYNIGSGILRAVGDSKRPLYFLIVSCFSNIILDVLFVVILNMSVAGAALATILSQLISAILILYVLSKSSDSYRLSFRSIRLDWDILRRTIHVGLPAGLQSVMYNISNIIIQTSVNTLGTDTIAAWTAYGKIDALFWMMINAFGISITTFAGQNYGAGKKDRVRAGIHSCLLMTFTASILLSAILYFGGGYVYRLFTDDPLVLEKGIEILHFLVPTFVTYVCVEILSGSLRGVGDSWIPMLITCLGVCVLRIIWIFFAVPLNPDIKTVIFSYPMTWTISTILFIIYYRFFSKLSIRSEKASPF